MDATEGLTNLLFSYLMNPSRELGGVAEVAQISRTRSLRETSHFCVLLQINRRIEDFEPKNAFSVSWAVNRPLAYTLRVS